MENKEASLMQVLEFREKKAQIQRELGAQGTENVVISLGLNIPGPVKSGPLLLEAFREGQRCLKQMIENLGGTEIQSSVIEEPAGYASVCLVRGIDRYMLKKETVWLEESHALGRLFDLDVFGENQEPITREMAGAGRRCCFLCGQDAKICGRNRTHSVKELQDKVQEILVQWKEGKENGKKSGMPYTG